jgi:hypothetical protein
MKSKKVLMIALLAFSFLAPLQLSSTASAESSDVLATGDLVRPNNTIGTRLEAYCPTGMAAVGISVAPVLVYYSSTVRAFHMQCLSTAIPKDGVKYFPNTRVLLDKRESEEIIRDAFCPPGSVLLGIRSMTVYESTFGDLGPVCGSPVSGKVTLDSNIGVAARKVLTTSSICPATGGKPTYVIGIESFSTNREVSGVKVLCGRTLKIDSPVLPPIPTSTNFNYEVVGKVLRISVDASREIYPAPKDWAVYLTSPILGYETKNKLKGAMKNGTVLFNIPFKSAWLGKEFPIQLTNLVTGSESEPRILRIKIPNSLPSKTTPTPKVITPDVPSIRCTKAGVTRVFTATSCPPGYTK